MDERVVKVSLQAQVSNYVANMEQAAKKTRTVGTEAEQAQKKLEAQSQAMTEVGAGLIAVGALAAVGVALAVKKFADFDEAISNVKAATQETSENMGLLREAALDAGARTVFSATEAANAIEQLGKNGLSTAQILDGGLNGALALASAGQLDVARAAEIAAISMKQFGLEGEDIPRIADLLAAGAGKAAGDVEDLAQALNQSALVAAQTGLSIEDTTGTLAAFADAGLVGSDAGTAFKSMLQRLTPVSAESKKAMDELGISAYDAQGDFIGIEGFAGNLQDKLKDLTVEQRNAALAQIFGSDAVRSASRLYELGAEGIAKYIDQTNDSGFAAKVAADRLDNLKGDVEQLGGAFDTALIRSGSGANDSLRALTQGATGLVSAIGDLPAPALAAGLALGVVVASAALVGGTALVAIPKMAAFKVQLGILGVTGRTAALGIGASTLALSAFVFALGAIAAANADAANTSSEFQDSLDQSTGAVTGYTRELVAKKLAEKDAFDGAERAGVSQRELTDAIIEGGDRLDEVKKKIRDSGTFFDVGKGNSLNAILGLRSGLDDAAVGFRNMAAAGIEADESTESVTGAFGEGTSISQDYEEALTGIVDALRDYGAAAFDVEGSTDSYYAAIDDLTKILNDGKGSLDQTTEAGRTTSAAMLDTAKSTNDYAASVLNAGGSTEEVQGILEGGRQKIIDTRIALGDTREAAEAYADQLVKTPAQIATDIKANTAEATSKVQQFIRDLNNIPGQRDVIINQVVRQTGAARGAVAAAYGADGFVMDFYGNGGLRENHVAQIAPAGAWRVWAEEETGGESYIPLAPSKRARSLQIWEETGKRLGVAGYANGYVTPVQYVSGGGSAGSGGGSSAPVAVSVELIPAEGEFGRAVDARIFVNGQRQSLTSRMGRQR